MMITHSKHRRSIRLPGYDYATKGGYFLTLCTGGRVCLFGEVVDDEMRSNSLGDIVREEWFRTPVVRPGVCLYPHEFVLMPNHIHGIIWIADSPVGASRRVAPTNIHGQGLLPGSIGAIIGQFKSHTTKRINAHRGTPGSAVWQRNYYEHIIRSGESLDHIRQYIAENPARWAFDHENPLAIGPEPVFPWARP